MSSHPPSTLIQPSRPTTATSSGTHSSSARGLSALAPPSTATTAAPPLRQRGPIPNLLPLFTKSASVRGTVRIKVEDTVFLAHRDVLALGSPFFESLLLGDWRETVKQQRKPQPQPSSCPRGDEEFEREHGEEDGPAGGSKRESFRTAHSITSIDETDEEAALALLGTLRLGDEPPRALLGDEEVSEAGDVAPSMTASYLSSFQDFLCHLYPRLELLVTWANAGELLRLAAKFDVPSLRNACIAFLLPSCAGNPIQGMKIAEDNHIPELFKEASRYALDNYQNWPAEELATLSEPTLLKLERRRSWFLERLLKLGLVQISRDYTCTPSCPDATLCARLVDEKWRSAWASAFRFGTPQPSFSYRSLRMLEPSLSSPALHLLMTACQENARLFIADLFDRMFSLSVTPSRGWGALTINGTMSGFAGGYGRTFGPSADVAQAKSSARYFLFIEMHDGNKKERSTQGGAVPGA